MIFYFYTMKTLLLLGRYVTISKKTKHFRGSTIFLGGTDKIEFLRYPRPLTKDECLLVLQSFDTGFQYGRKDKASEILKALSP